jgi:hypothetical protein
MLLQLGKVFHSLIVLGYNESFRTVVLHDGMRNACSLLFLEGRSYGISLLDASTRTMLFFSLYIISNRLCFLRSCKVVHSSCSIMLLTDEVLWYARPQYGRIRYIPERSRNGTPCLTVLSLP